MKKYILLIFLSLSIVYAQHNKYQAFQPFNRNAASGVTLPKPGNIIFRADLTSSITPQIGASGTFARASTVTYGISNVLFGTASSGNPAIPATYFGGNGVGYGIQIGGNRTNLLFHSKTFGTSQQCAAGPTNWTNTGTFSVDQSIGSTGPDGAANIWQLTATSSPAGKICNIGAAAANNVFTASVYVKSTFGGNVFGAIIVEGTGGTPETTTNNFTATNAWQRVSISKAFSGAATGNVQIRFQVTTGGTSITFDDAQLEQNNAATGNDSLVPSAYIASTSGTASASVELDNLNYPSSNINVTTGSLSIWVNPFFSNTTGPISNRYAFSVTASDIALRFARGVGWIGDYKGTNTVADNNAFSAGTWKHFVHTWSQSGGNVTVNLYSNGAFIGTNTYAAVAATAGAIQIGYVSNLATKAGGEWIIGKTRIWDTVLNATEARQVCLAENIFYGVTCQ